MSQETTQDLTQPKIEDSTQEHQDDHENGSESIAMLEYEDPTTGEMLGEFHTHFLPMPLHS
jgi:hypothetical protein